MANEIRLRINNVGGVITDNPLTIGATTINSPGFADLPTVDATSHLVLILDPQEVGGPAEIVRVTAHTAASTSCTVLRGQEGSLARSHVFNTTWFHGPVESDYVDIFTSGTRPAWAYEGMFGYETDTNKLIGFGGTDWAPRDAGGTLGFAQASAVNQTYTTPAVLVTGVTTTVTVGTGRRVKVTVHFNWAPNAVGDQTDASIRQDGVNQKLIQDTGETAGRGYPVSFYCILTPSAGTHTYELFVERTVGAGNLTILNTANRQALILVEDIGAA